MNSMEEIVSQSMSRSWVRDSGLSWPMLLGALAFLMAIASGAVRIGPDTYWHIVAGRWILSHGYVPTHDVFSFSMHGAPWIAQEWGAELLMAPVYGLTGWTGLTLLCAALFGLTIAYLARFLLVRMEPLHAVSLTALAACMMFSYIIVRPYEFVWPLTALWVGVLIESVEGSDAPPWWLLGVMWLWANMHGSFILGLGLPVMIGVEAVLNAKERWKSTGVRWLTFIAAASGCAMLNPQGYRLLLFPFHLIALHALGQLTEWQQPNFQHPQVFGLWLLALLALAFAGRIRLPPIRSALLLGLIYVALEHGRNISLLGLISPFLVARPLASLWRQMLARRTDAQALDRGFRALAGRGTRLALCATVVLSGALGLAMTSGHEPMPPKRFTPRAALDVLLTRVPHARILNDLNFGGYLIFRGVPVFVDSRAELYGDEFFQSYFDAVEMSSGEHFNALVAKYRIDAILIGPEWPLVRVLDKSRDWKRVYADRVAVAYLRRGVVKS